MRRDTLSFFTPVKLAHCVVESKSKKLIHKHILGLWQIRLILRFTNAVFILVASAQKFHIPVSLLYPHKYIRNFK